MRHGFAPAGGGELVADIAPARAAHPLVLVERGPRLSHAARAVVSHLPRQIGERELATLCARLNWGFDPRAVVAIDDSPGPGNVVEATVRYANVTEVVTSIGERRLRAEQVASACAEGMQDFLRATAPVGEYLLDQLLVPLAAGGELGAIRWSRHAEAQRELLRAWFGRDITVVHRDDGVRVTVPAMATP